MTEILSELQRLFSEITTLNRRIDNYEIARQFDNWIPRDKLMDFLGYQDTQIATVLKDKNLIISKIGNRKFIKKESILKLLEGNIEK